MKALIAAIALVFVVGVVAPASADAKDYAFRFGGILLRATTELDEDCSRSCEGASTYGIAGRLGSTNRSGKKLHPRVRTIRVTIWKDMPGQRWDKRVKSRTWRNVRLGIDNNTGGGGSEFVVRVGCIDGDPIGTEYYAKTRIKKTKTSAAIWLKSKPRTLRFPCVKT